MAKITTTEKENWNDMTVFSKVLYVGICICFALMVVAIILQLLEIWPSAFVGVRVLLSIALVFEGIRCFRKKLSTSVFCFAVAVFILVLSFF